MPLWSYLGRKFMLRDEEYHRLPRRPMRLARQCLVVAIFVIFVFTLTSMNVSFDTTFHKASDALGTRGAIYLTANGTIDFNVPPNTWYWNSDRAFIDNATLAIWQNVKRPFDAMTWAVAIMLFVKEASASYSDARRDGEENRKNYGYLYVLGVKPADIWGAFFAQKVVASFVGVAAGSALSICVVLPYILSLFQGTVGALFFQSFDYAVSLVAASFMVSLNVSITAIILLRSTQHGRLRAVLSEIA